MESQFVNYKSLLQEYLQSKQLPLPEYNSKRCGGEDHNPQWVCDITIDLNLDLNPDKPLAFETTTPLSTKKDAEQLAAKLALDYLSTVSEEKINVACKANANEHLGSSKMTTWKLSYINSKPVILYIDVENQSSSTLKILDLLKRSKNGVPNIKFVFVMSRKCNLLEKVRKFDYCERDNAFSSLHMNSAGLDCRVLLTSSLSPDAADIMTVLQIGYHIGYCHSSHTKSTSIFILSSDTFAATTKDVLEGVAKESSVGECTVLTSYSEFEKLFLA